MGAPTQVEYMCTYCGMTQIRRINAGRPNPGSCTRKGKNALGMWKPHSWVVNRKF